jgi:hypothetical protein
LFVVFFTLGLHKKAIEKAIDIHTSEPIRRHALDNLCFLGELEPAIVKESTLLTALFEHICSKLFINFYRVPKQKNSILYNKLSH